MYLTIELTELLMKPVLTLAELELFKDEYFEEVDQVKDIGISRNLSKVGLHVYNVTLINGEEYEIYTK
jgi:hypothetical protein